MARAPARLAAPARRARGRAVGEAPAARARRRTARMEEEKKRLFSKLFQLLGDLDGRLDGQIRLDGSVSDRPCSKTLVHQQAIFLVLQCVRVMKS